MSEITVLAHGLRQKEPKGESVDRRSGVGSFSLIRFHSPMEVLTAQGLVPAKSGDCILLAPNYPHYYQGTVGEWSNDWMHFVGNKVELHTTKYGVPFNVLMTPHRTSFLPLIFEEIANEERLHMDGWKHAIELLMCQLFFKLGRELKQNAMFLTPTEVEHLIAMRELRQRIHTDLTRAWTVDEMAHSVGLSSSRFATLYQRFFGISPVEDLLRSRIRYAQYLLTNRSSLISDVAKRCGFRNVNYFSTVFQRRVGCSPSHYQRHVPNFAREMQERL